MTCARPIRNAHPMPSPELIVPNPPLPDSRVVTPEDLRTYMQRYTEELLGPIGAWMIDAEMAWKSVFRNTPDVGPLEIDNDSASPYIGMVRDPGFGALQATVDEVETTISAIQDDITTLETCCTTLTGAVEDLEDRVAALEAATPGQDCPCLDENGVCCIAGSCTMTYIDCEDCRCNGGTWFEGPADCTICDDCCAP